MGKLLVALLALIAVAVVSGCTSPKSNVPYQPASFGQPDLESVAPSEGLQRIAPMDKINVNVFQVESLSGEFQVDSAGVISFPLIGTVEAQGKTAPELGKAIAQRLGAKYLQNPNVQVSIKESVAQTVTVDGSVRQPGVYPVKGSITLMRAVALARGASEDANTNRVIVFRTIKGQRMAAAFDRAAIRRATADDPVIYGNDIVVVDGSRARSVFGYVLASLPLLSFFRPF
jgi:polysaccharide export outer membrane protein